MLLVVFPVYKLECDADCKAEVRLEFKFEFGVELLGLKFNMFDVDIGGILVFEIGIVVVLCRFVEADSGGGMLESGIVLLLLLFI